MVVSTGLAAGEVADASGEQGSSVGSPAAADMSTV